MGYNCEDKLKDERDYLFDHPEIEGMSMQELHENYTLTFSEEDKGARRGSGLVDKIISH